MVFQNVFKLKNTFSKLKFKINKYQKHKMCVVQNYNLLYKKV